MILAYLLFVIKLEQPNVSPFFLSPVYIPCQPHVFISADTRARGHQSAKPLTGVVHSFSFQSAGKSRQIGENDPRRLFQRQAVVRILITGGKIIFLGVSNKVFHILFYKHVNFMPLCLYAHCIFLVGELQKKHVM